MRDGETRAAPCCERVNLIPRETSKAALVIARRALDISRTMPSIEFSVISGSNEDLIVECLHSLYESIADLDYDVTVTATCNTPGTRLAAMLRAFVPGSDAP